MNNNFASNLKYLRIQSGMTQEELAKKLDKDYSTIGKWELGQRSPIMVDVIRVSELFNVSLETLINGSVIDDNKISANKNDFDEYAVLFDKYKTLSEDDKELIKNIIETRRKQMDEQLSEYNQG